MEYNLQKPWKSLDPWQEEIRKEKKKNLCIVSGRQCGKSAGVSIVIGDTALEVPNSYILMGAHDIEQTEMLFWKVVAYIEAVAPEQIVKSTMHYLLLKNGSQAVCKAVGDTGVGMRGPTATLVVLDEAAFIPDRAWIAIEPVISVSKGRIILLSTGQEKKGFFYKASLDKDYLVKKISARDCPRHSQAYLDKKQKELSPAAFAQEYLGEFIDDYNRKFTDEWIKKVCCLEKKKVVISVKSCHVLGVDVGGGVGKGETTFETFNADNKKNIYQVGHIYSNTIGGPDIQRQIESLKQTFNYGRESIGYDSRGEGSGSFKYMAEDDDLKRCMVALDNATRPIGRDGKTTKLLKEFMYDAVEEAGWRGEVKCFNDGAIKQSFQSIQVEHKSGGDRHYSGAYNHIVEGIVRAFWQAQNKGLNIYLF